MGCFGRKKIFTDVTEITRDNVLNVLRKALITHWSNKQIWNISMPTTKADSRF